MSNSVNKVILAGNLGKDPEIRLLDKNNPESKVAVFPLATSESWKDKSGEYQQKTEWHNVVIYNPRLAALVERKLAKGSQVYIEGQIESRKWQDNGTDRYITEIVLRPYRGELVILNGAKNNGDANEAGGEVQNEAPAKAAAAPAQTRATRTRRAQAQDAGDLDDEIPF